MSFLQIITFATDRFDEFVALEHEWSETPRAGAPTSARRCSPTATPGSLRRARLVRLPRVGHGQLAPPGDRRLRPAGRRARDRGARLLRTSSPSRPRGTPVRRRSAPALESSTVAPHTFADDVDLDVLVPHGRMRATGRVRSEESLRAEAPARDIEVWNSRATADGFVVEYAYRTHAEPVAGRGDHGGHPEGRARPAPRDHVRRQLVGRDRGTGRRGDRSPRTPHPRECPMTAEEVEVTGAVTERLFGALLGAIELATVHLGVRLGLYDALATPRTAAGLAQAAGIDERYAREWLEQQAISGLVSVVEPGDGDSRVYGLDPEQAASFGDPDSPSYAGSMALRDGWRRAGAARCCPRSTAPGRGSRSAATATTSGSGRPCSTAAASSAS